jgi:hypothetical protein
MKKRTRTLTLRLALTAVLAAGVVGAVGPGSARAAGGRPSVKEFLPRLGFTAADLAALDRGEVISRILKTEMVSANDTAEVAIAGAVRVDATRQAFLDAAKDVRVFRKRAKQTIGLISTPPALADFHTLVLPPDDIADLKACRPGKCALKLAGEGLMQLKASINWKAPDAAAKVHDFARQRLLSAATDYTRVGTPGFLPLEDKATKVSIDDQFQALLKNTPNVIAFYPELAEHLRSYPKTPANGATDILYWANADFGLKPTVTITHAVMYAPPGTEDAVAAWKQLYASHYFNGSLGLTTYAKDGAVAYLIHLDRVRADSLGGAFGGIKRSKMASSMESVVRTFLETARDNLKKK